MRDKIALEMYKVFYNEVLSLEEAAKYLGISRKEYTPVIHWPKVVAKRAYAHADAMLEARDMPVSPGDE